MNKALQWLMSTKMNTLLRRSFIMSSMQCKEDQDPKDHQTHLQQIAEWTVLEYGPKEKLQTEAASLQRRF